jgi:hypothetical protein
MLKAKLLVDKHYSAAWVTTFPPIKAGTIVPVEFAHNQPQNGAGDHIRYWIMTPELLDDPYGVGLYDGEFKLI